jgi:hypothetical protein
MRRRNQSFRNMLQLSEIFLRNIPYWVENDVLSHPVVDPGCRRLSAGGLRWPLPTVQGRRECDCNRNRRPQAGTLNPGGEAAGSRFRAGRPSFSGVRRQETRGRREKHTHTDHMTTYARSVCSVKPCPRSDEQTADDSDPADGRGPLAVRRGRRAPASALPTTKRDGCDRGARWATVAVTSNRGWCRHDVPNGRTCPADRGGGCRRGG